MLTASILAHINTDVTSLFLVTRSATIQFYMSIPQVNQHDLGDRGASPFITLFSFQNGNQVLLLRLCFPSNTTGWQFVLTTSNSVCALPLRFPPPLSDTAYMHSHLFTLVFTPTACDLFIDSHHSITATFSLSSLFSSFYLFLGDACSTPHAHPDPLITDLTSLQHTAPCVLLSSLVVWREALSHDIISSL